MNAILAISDAILSRGVAIAISGLAIVFVALLLISLFIASLPGILRKVASIWPEVDEPSAIARRPESLAADDGHVLAAIGFVLHTELQRQLAAEQTSSSTRKN